MRAENDLTVLSPEQFLRALPKVNLHCHLQGTISASTVIALAQKHGVEVPLNSNGELFDLVDRATPEDRERRFFELLDVVTSVVVDHDDFARISYELVRDHAAPYSVKYTEIFFPPTAFAGVSYTTMLNGICDGLDSAEQEYGVRASLIPAILRECGPAVGEQMVREVIANPNDRVVGIGLEGPEETEEQRAGHFAHAFELAKSAGLRRTAHATLAEAAEVEACVELLDCDRIDHGYRILESAELAQRIKDDGRTVTVCPTITRVVFGSEADPKWLRPGSHPARKMIEAGLPVSIGTDDGCVVPCDINQEYLSLLGGELFDADVAAEVALQGATATWLPDLEREQLVDTFTARIAGLQRRLQPAQA